jgi:hypothetical protein
MAESKTPPWNMKGTLIIACNCEYGCPCNVNGRPTLGHCEGGWTWQIEQGVYGDLKLDGLNLGLYCDWPAMRSARSSRAARAGHGRSSARRSLS